MDAASVTGNTTVVGGRLSHIGETDYLANGHPSPTQKPVTSVKGGFANAAKQPFGEAADYLSQQRPFCVSIGKEGLIVALKKLDEQLRQVCLSLPLLELDCELISYSRVNRIGR